MILLYPGSFDPPTIGHIDIIRRAARLSETLYVAVMVNIKKKALLDATVRADMLKKCVPDLENVIVMKDRGLVMELAKKLGASAIVRGIRDEKDYAAEGPVAEAFMKIAGVETLFIKADPAHSFISSSMVRELLGFHGPIDALVPEAILGDLDRLPR